MSAKFKINGRAIGDKHPPYVIAEMSANHNGRIENAYKIIEEAKKCGADAVKLQTYRPDTLTFNCASDDFQIRDGLWKGKTLYELYESAFMPWDWHKPLYDHAARLGITIFSSPFDKSAIDLLEDLNSPAYKIASFEATDLSLISYAASTGKPMLISTGMADAEEIQEAVDAARGAGCKELALLHCVSGYPAPVEDYNLQTIVDMIKRFGVVIGLSDHTLENTTAFASVALGARILEKHFTLDRRGGGPDDSFSLEPDSLKELCCGVRKVWQSIGEVNYGLKSSEKGSVKFRRSLYFVRDMKAGDIIMGDSIRSVRPGYGMSPKYFEKIIGLSVRRDVSARTPVLKDDIDFVDSDF